MLLASEDRELWLQALSMTIITFYVKTYITLSMSYIRESVECYECYKRNIVLYKDITISGVWLNLIYCWHSRPQSPCYRNIQSYV